MAQSANPIQWEVSLREDIPAARAKSLIMEKALELGDGGFLVSGKLEDDFVLLRFDARGRRLWYRQDSIGPESASLSGYLRLFETQRGAAVVRSVQSRREGVLAPQAILLDATGAPADRLALDRTLPHAVLPDGDILHFRHEPGAPGEAARLTAYRHRLGTGPRWSLDLGAAPDRLGLHVHGLDDGALLVFLPARGLNGQEYLDVHRISPEGSREDGGRVPLEFNTYPDGLVARWDQSLAMGPDRIMLAGIGNGRNDPPGNPTSDSLRLLGFTAQGRLVSSQAHALGSLLNAVGGPGDMGLYGNAGYSWSVTALALSPEGFRLRIKHRHPEHSGLFAFDADGKTVLPIARPLWNAPVLSGGMLPLTDGTWLSWGCRLDSIGAPPTAYDLPKATHISHPSLALTLADSTWKAQRFPEYGDTVFTTLETTPMSYRVTQHPVAGFRFLLPTSDGGYLAGGALWKQGAAGAEAVGAVKLAPGYTVSLAKPRKALSARAWRSIPGRTFDLLGRRAGPDASGRQSGMYRAVHVP